VAAVAAGAFLATPYAFSYDAALLAVATVFILADVSEARPLSLAEKAGLVLAFVTPFIANPWPTIAPSAAALLAIAAWRARPSARITEISRPASHPCVTVEASS
ncbi:MAG: hypothetical protein INR64_03475, partial [Caulobacteraceae bacterium]|nr:hypothetical protein [Caulobacter sp.]